MVGQEFQGKSPGDNVMRFVVRNAKNDGQPQIVEYNEQEMLSLFGVTQDDFSRLKQFPGMSGVALDVSDLHGKGLDAIEGKTYYDFDRFKAFVSDELDKISYSVAEIIKQFPQEGYNYEGDFSAQHMLGELSGTISDNLPVDEFPSNISSARLKIIDDSIAWAKGKLTDEYDSSGAQFELGDSKVGEMLQNLDDMSQNLSTLEGFEMQSAEMIYQYNIGYPDGGCPNGSCSADFLKLKQ